MYYRACNMLIFIGLQTQAHTLIRMTLELLDHFVWQKNNYFLKGHTKRYTMYCRAYNMYIHWTTNSSPYLNKDDLMIFICQFWCTLWWSFYNISMHCLHWPDKSLMFSDIWVTRPFCLTEKQIFFKKGTPKGTPDIQRFDLLGETAHDSHIWLW